MQNESVFLIDGFSAATINERDMEVKIRLFPFGVIYKDGISKQIDREYASKFRLPHYQPPLKIGSHKQEAVGGGKYYALEVGDDGLYGLAKLNDNGWRALKEKHYGYHSPEVIWEGGFLENPSDGSRIEGPMIVGDALLHNPHLGESTALYSIEPKTDIGDNKMDENMVPVPESFLARLMSTFTRKEEVEERGAQVSDEFAAKLQASQDKITALESQVKAMEAEAARKGRVAEFASKLKNEPVETAEILAELDDDVAEKLVGRFNAVAAQAAHNVDQDVGNSGNGDELNSNPSEILIKSVDAYCAEHGVDFNAGFDAVAKENPEIVSEYFKNLRGGA